jgi:hypothetical protein
MKNRKLQGLILRMENASGIEKTTFMSLSDEIALKVLGGVVATNTSCTNDGCTAGSNSGCTNGGCTTGTTNSSCHNHA